MKNRILYINLSKHKMQKFFQEFNTLNYVIKEAENILIWSHSHPDGDTTGSALALKEYIKSFHKNVDAACFDPIPEYLQPIIPKEEFIDPQSVDFKKYKLIIACDAVDRGFAKIRNQFSENQVIAIIDHHQSVETQGDINIIEAGFSSVCEIIYDFFLFNKIEINKKIANYLLLGILYDTGIFQNSSTTSKIMGIASELLKKGAQLPKIIEAVFANKKITTLKLWGRAFEKARINPQSGMIASVITRQEIEEFNANTDDVAYVSVILNTVPGTKFSLILSERENGIIKGSLRSEAYKNVDVSKIAAAFGGGGHKLASGFEIEGKIIETENGWEIA